MFKILVVFLLISAGIQAGAVDADFSGEYRFRVNSTSSTGDGLVDNLGSNLSSEIRAKVSSSFRPSESFEGVAALYLNLDDNHLLLQDQMVAYGDWMISDEFMLRAGQSTYKIADGSVLGINDYDAVPSLFKGLFLTHSSENIGLDFALIQNKDVKDLLVVSVDARSFPDLVKTANFHLIIQNPAQKLDLQDKRPVLNGGGESLPGNDAGSNLSSEEDASAESKEDGVYLGTTLGGGAGSFSYRLTASTDSLNNILGLSNLLLDGKVSYSFEMDNSSLKAFAGGHRDGSDYSTLVYEKHYNAGEMDRAVWGGGLTYAYGGLAYKTNTDWKLGFKAYYFVEGNASVAKGDMEVDAYLKKNFNSSVMGKVWVGAFVPQAEGSTDVRAEAVVGMKF